MSVSILACTYRGLSAQTHMSVLNATAMLGWPHRTVSDDALLDHARGVLVSDWYRQTEDDAFVMVDDDIMFAPNDLHRLVNHLSEVDAVSGLYPARLGQTLSGVPLNLGLSATALDGDELIELDRSGMGCIAVSRATIQRLTECTEECYAENGRSFWPFFLPFIQQRRYIGEDMAFSKRLRDAGLRLWLDPQVRVAHLSRELPVTVANMTEVWRAYETYRRNLSGGVPVAA